MGSYKASLGCTPCAQRTIAGLKLSDEELLKEFEKARQEVEVYLRERESGKVPAKKQAAKAQELIPA
jgi:hypothetical protein